ncbi:hypothetical protein HanPI659440_Chr01g0024931 [Helianthus annuus]|nr:hypothetical protein HanPI659440_Chr01g0024931 [Helianthus annuus]
MGFPTYTEFSINADRLYGQHHISKIISIIHLGCSPFCSDRKKKSL